MKLKALFIGISIALASTVAHAADTFLVQFDDTAEGSIVATTFKNGNQMGRPSSFQDDSANTTIPIFVGAVVGGFDDQFNFFEPGTRTLSDTAEARGTRGAHSVSFTLLSDAAGRTLKALPNGGAHDETGKFQNISTFVVSNGDSYTIQVASDVPGIPEPATWAMMLVGLGGLGAVMRTTRRKSGAALAAA